MNYDLLISQCLKLRENLRRAKESKFLDDEVKKEKYDDKIKEIVKEIDLLTKK